jgi:hypothetical protein
MFIILNVISTEMCLLPIAEYPTTCFTPAWKTLFPITFYRITFDVLYCVWDFDGQNTIISEILKLSSLLR